ncbi:DUF3011 domain-containing protein [Sandarakinorhabdus sp.]|uniref:DUF3011 domain-containing protein n=1 Tax=Sandarakinorhabdus sp. TaxID=1916663 RepID=UPI00286E4F32|nr:DUF3011 domain-containing protein [Sandarakinorhabdus sp.]
MAITLLRLAPLLALGLAGLSAPAAAQNWNSNSWNGGGWNGGGDVLRTRCESWNWRDAHCPLPGPVAGVQLRRVFGGDCIEGQTWRWDRNSIDVRGGCRAEFFVQTGGVNGGGWNGGGWNDGGWNGGGWNSGGNFRTIRCNSWNWQPARCRVDIRRGVQIVRIDGGRCIEGRSWGWDRRGIWVQDGCRAVFRIG